ncbi:MAG: hypothetical protein ACLQM8_00620 [Limisphaerales bacterium]
MRDTIIPGRRRRKSKDRPETSQISSLSDLFEKRAGLVCQPTFFLGPADDPVDVRPGQIEQPGYLLVANPSPVHLENGLIAPLDGREWGRRSLCKPKRRQPRRRQRNLVGFSGGKGLTPPRPGRLRQAVELQLHTLLKGILGEARLTVAVIQTTGVPPQALDQTGSRTGVGERFHKHIQQPDEVGLADGISGVIRKQVLKLGPAQAQKRRFPTPGSGMP